MLDQVPETPARFPRGPWLWPQCLYLRIEGSGRSLRSKASLRLETGRWPSPGPCSCCTHTHPCPQGPTAWNVGPCACPDRAPPASTGTGIQGAGLLAGEAAENEARRLLLTLACCRCGVSPGGRPLAGDSPAHAQPRPHIPEPCPRGPPARKLNIPLTQRPQPWGVLPQGHKNVLSGPTGDSP